MDIDALHSALFSLTVLPEKIRTAHDNLLAVQADCPTGFTVFLEGLERDLRIAKATLARELGFAVCTCCWPPEICVTDKTDRPVCPHSGQIASQRMPSASRPGLSKNGSKSRQVDRFTRTQREKLLQMRDLLVDSVRGPDAGFTANGNKASTSVGDIVGAGNDAVNRDFALRLLSQECDALAEVDAALKRLDGGTYGICEMSGERIPRARLEALPAARYTVECQGFVEKDRRFANSRSTDSSLIYREKANEAENQSAAPSRAPRRPVNLTAGRQSQDRGPLLSTSSISHRDVTLPSQEVH